MNQIENLRSLAFDSEKEHRWEEASDLFLRIAHFYKDSKHFDNAADYFMRAAITRERCEDWRRVGFYWVECAAALEARSIGPVVDVFDHLQSSKHFFPTLDFHAWNRFEYPEKIGRAYRNAAYHLEKAGSNQSAYIQYRKSGDAFRDAGMPEEASRSYFRALISFIERNGELDDDTLDELEKTNVMLVKKSERKFLKRSQLYYRGLAGKLAEVGNAHDADSLFCKEHDIERKLARRDRRIGKWLAYSAWKATSDYGNSFWLWSAWAFALFGGLFPTVFRFSGVLHWQESGRAANWLDYVFFSFAAVTTASDTSFGLGHAAKCLVMIEGLIGFLMLGSLLTLLVKKIMR